MGWFYFVISFALKPIFVFRVFHFPEVSGRWADGPSKSRSEPRIKRNAESMGAERSGSRAERPDRNSNQRAGSRRPQRRQKSRVFFLVSRSFSWLENTSVRCAVNTFVKWTTSSSGLNKNPESVLEIEQVKYLLIQQSQPNAGSMKPSYGLLPFRWSLLKSDARGMIQKRPA